MVNTPGRAVDSSRRSIPSVERILSAASFAPLVSEYGRDRVKDAVVEHLATLRANRAAYDEQEAIDSASASLSLVTGSTLRRTVNGSGVIIHTNLGRSPVDPAIWAEAAEIVSGYSNLE